MKRRKLQICAYIIFGIFIFLLSLILTFPFDSLAPVISGIVEKETGVRLDIKSIRPLLVSGLSFRDILIFREKEERPYHLDIASISVPLFSLISFSPKIDCLIKKKEGILKGRFKRTGKDKIGVSFILNTPSVKSLFKNQKLVVLDGKIKAEGNLQLPLKTLSKGIRKDNFIKNGDIAFTIEEGEIKTATIPIPGFSSIPFKMITGKASFSKGMLRVELLEMDGDLNASIKGNILIRHPLPKSKMNLKIKLKPSKALLNRLGPFIALLNKKTDKDGYYNFNVNGAVSNIINLLPSSQE